MEDACPWCNAEYQPVYGSYDAWLEGHIQDCAEYQAEQGGEVE